MALDIRPNCKVCQAIQADTTGRLVKDIFATSFYIKGAHKTLTGVYKKWAENGRFEFRYLALLKHVKNHQHMTQDELDRKRFERNIAKAQNDALSTTIKDVTHDKVRRRIMEKGMQELESGKMVIRAKDLLNAANKEADIEDRQKDRTERIVKAIYAFASGAVSPTALGGNGTPGTSQEFIESDTR